MSISGFRFLARAALGLTLLSGLTLSAQVPAGLNSALLKVFGDNNVFTAKAEAQLLDASKQEIASVPMDFAMLGGKVRLEIDMTQARKKDTPPGMIDALKRMGLAHVIALIRPDRKVTYVIYPDQKMLLAKPFSPEEAAAVGKAFKVAKTPLGKENCVGHACTKNKVVLTDEAGRQLEVTAWNATDLKDFPVQIETPDKPNSSFLRFKQIDFTPPAAEQFDPPAGYAEYKDEMEMMQGLSKKVDAEEKK